jgi:hypothetical protein
VDKTASLMLQPRAAAPDGFPAPAGLEINAC